MSDKELIELIRHTLEYVCGYIVNCDELPKDVGYYKSSIKILCNNLEKKRPKTLKMSRSRRNSYDVILQIKDKIPPEIEYDKEVLEDIISSAMYQAPESRWIWGAINDFVNELIPYPPIEDWHKEIANILLNEKKY